MNCSLAEEPWEKIAQLGYNNLNSGSAVAQCLGALPTMVSFKVGNLAKANVNPIPQQAGGAERTAA
jgi:hypothetical protein